MKLNSSDIYPHRDNRGRFVRLKLRNPASYMRFYDGDLVRIEEDEESENDGILFLWRPDWDCKNNYTADQIKELATGYNERIFAILDAV